MNHMNHITYSVYADTVKSRHKLWNGLHDLQENSHRKISIKRTFLICVKRTCFFAPKVSALDRFPDCNKKKPKIIRRTASFYMRK